MPKKTKKEDLGGISWRAAEYQYVEKDIGWYFIVGLITFFIVVFALLKGNFFFAIFIILAAIVIFFFARRRPQVFDFRVTDKGVAIGGNIFYDYERLESFAIRERPEKLDEIVLKRKTALNPYVKIPVDSTYADKARKVLENKLPEIEYEESLIEIISEWLGF
jgi:hypothetical protein